MAPNPEIGASITKNENGKTNVSTESSLGYTNKAFENDATLLKRALSDVALNGLGDSKNNKSDLIIDRTIEGDPSPIETRNELDFDDFLPHIGEFGRYQKFLFFLMLPFAFFVAFTYFSQIFITLVPEKHWCRIPELEHLSIVQRLSLGIPLDADSAIGGYSKCSMYAVNFTKILAENITNADPNWPTSPCKHGWEFDTDEIPYSTISTELEWVCDNAALPSIAQSVFFCGAILGGFLFGWIADRYGRIPALVGSNLIGCVGGVATGFSYNFLTFTICRFVVGFAFDNCFTMMYILVLEYVGPKYRTFVANMSIAIFFTMAACILPWIALWLNNWQMTIIVTSAPLALAVLSPWIIPESARWLVSQGETTRAISILKKFERINKTTVKPEIYAEFNDSCERLAKEDEANSNYSVLDLFKTPRLRNITILFIIIWMSISLAFDGHVRNVSALGLNVFITFTVAAATEFPADFMLTYTLDRVGRRWYAFASMTFSGIFSLLATLFPFGFYSALMAIMGRFWVNIAYNIGLQYAAEVLPTVVRAQGVSFIHIMGYVANIVAPFVVYLSYISPSLPLLILGAVGIFGGVLSLFLPETMDKELPQTLMDGEEFGRDQKFLDFPCCTKKNGDDETDIGNFKRSIPGSVGASLRASSRAEIGSNMLYRSLRARKTTVSNNEK